MIIITNEIREKLIYDYIENNLSIDALNKKYFISRDRIIKLFNNNGVKLKSHSEARRRYTVNSDYFNIVDDENKAYWLGLLYADGCNGQDRCVVELTLKETDKYLLEAFKIDINSNSKLSFRRRTLESKNNSNQYRLTLCNKNLCDSLAKLGCISNKSLILKFPRENQVPKSLIWHWLRGLSDGDGSIWYDKTGTRGYTYGLASSLDVCQGIKNFIYMYTGIYCSITKQDNIYQLRIAGNKQVFVFLEKLYKDATIFMVRKYNKYKLLKDSMITYTYKCTNCNYQFENVQSIKSPKLKLCNYCQTQSLERVIEGGVYVSVRQDATTIGQQMERNSKKFGKTKVQELDATTPKFKQDEHQKQIEKIMAGGEERVKKYIMTGK